MSDLSEFVSEVEFDSPVLARRLCADCLPRLERSEWPRDTPGLPPALDGGKWPTEMVIVLNIGHATSCPSFRSAVANSEQQLGVYISHLQMPDGVVVLLRDTFDFGLVQ